MIGDGTTAYFSLCLGQKDTRSAAQGVGNAITLTVAVSIFFNRSVFALSQTPLYPFLVQLTPPCHMHWNTGTSLYWGFPFYAFGMGFNSILRADGSPVYAMVATLSGAILNTILDPIFIFRLSDGRHRCGHRHRSGADCFLRHHPVVSAEIQMHHPHKRLSEDSGASSAENYAVWASPVSSCSLQPPSSSLP